MERINAFQPSVLHLVLNVYYDFRMEVSRRVSIVELFLTSIDYPVRFTAFSFSPRKVPFVAAWKEMDRYTDKETQTEVETISQETQTEVETIDQET